MPVVEYFMWQHEEVYLKIQNDKYVFLCKLPVVKYIQICLYSYRINNFMNVKLPLFGVNLSYTNLQVTTVLINV